VVSSKHTDFQLIGSHSQDVLSYGRSVEPVGSARSSAVLSLLVRFTPLINLSTSQYSLKLPQVIDSLSIYLYIWQKTNYFYNYHNSGRYQSSCLLIKTRRFEECFLLILQVEPTQLGLSDRASLCLRTLGLSTGPT
jgi:hypothetical protein